MAKIKYIRITNYRSIGDETVVLRMPDDAPLVLVGPNNAGKSNIATAVDLVLGERWPGNDDPQDHEFHNRDTSVPISIGIEFDGLDYIDYRALGIDSKSMEYLMSANDWIIRAECSVFGIDFETALRALFGGAYRDLEQDASTYGLDKRSKPLVARHVAANIGMPLESPVYEKFREFSECVRAL